jgi:hypothetical protein
MAPQHVWQADLIPFAVQGNLIPPIKHQRMQALAVMMSEYQASHPQVGFVWTTSLFITAYLLFDYCLIIQFTINAYVGFLIK